MGAATIVYSLLLAVGIELNFEERIPRSSGPPRFELLLLPAYVIGGFVAQRLGRSRGTLLLALLAAIGMARALLGGWALPNIELAWHGLPPQDADLDFVTPQAWALVGVAMGSALNALWRPTMPFQTALAGAGIFGTGQALWAIVLTAWPTFICASPGEVAWCLDAENISSVASMTAFGVAAGAFVARHATLRTVGAVSLALALPALDVLAHQASLELEFGATFLLQSASTPIGAAAIVATAIIRSRGVGETVEGTRTADP